MSIELDPQVAAIEARPAEADGCVERIARAIFAAAHPSVTGDVRDQLADALRASHGQLRTVDEIADRLAPLVEAVAVQRVADALESTAHALDRERMAVAAGLVGCRAAALRADTWPHRKADTAYTDEEDDRG